MQQKPMTEDAKYEMIARQIAIILSGAQTMGMLINSMWEYSSDEPLATLLMTGEIKATCEAGEGGYFGEVTFPDGKVMSASSHDSFENVQRDLENFIINWIVAHSAPVAMGMDDESDGEVGGIVEDGFVPLSRDGKIH